MKKTWHEHDHREMTPPFCWFPLLEKRSKEVIPFAQFSALWLWVRNNFFIAAYMRVILSLRELKIVYVADITVLSVVLFRCEFRIISVRVSVADHFALSYRSCFVAVPVFTTTIMDKSLGTKLHFCPHSRCANTTSPA